MGRNGRIVAGFREGKKGVISDGYTRVAMVPSTPPVEKTPTVVERGAMLPEKETVGRLAELSTLEPAGTLVMMGGGIFMVLGAKRGNALVMRVIAPCGVPSSGSLLAPLRR